MRSALEALSANFNLQVRTRTVQHEVEKGQISNVTLIFTRLLPV